MEIDELKDTILAKLTEIPMHSSSDERIELIKRRIDDLETDQYYLYSWKSPAKVALTTALMSG